MASDVPPSHRSLDSKPSEAEFMRLFLRHESALRAFARSVLPTWDLVDDALQEASVTMWEKLDQLSDEEGFLPWAKVILRFKCLNLVTRTAGRQRLLSEDTLSKLADEAESVTNEGVAEVREALENCLSRFSNAHQQMLLAPYGGQGRLKELAEDSGKTTNAMYKLLGRLRGKLRQCVSDRLQQGWA